MPTKNNFPPVPKGAFEDETFEMRMLMLGVLIRVKAMLEDGEQDYVCYALHSVAKTDPTSLELGLACRTLRRFVEQALDPYPTLGIWLLRHQEDSKNDSIFQAWDRALKARPLWVQAMIEELKRVP